MSDIGQLYREGRERITRLVRPIGEEARRITVPACPEWTVHDVVAHLSGICVDVGAGRLDGIATPPWTAAQVDARRDVSTAHVLAEWESVAPGVEATAASFGPMGEQWLADLACHEQDIRAATGEPGAREGGALQVGLEFCTRVFLAGVAARRLPTLAVQVGGAQWASATGDPAVVLESSAWELFRALTGRRSPSQLASLGWSGEAAPYLPAFEYGPFHPARVPLVE